MCCVQRALHSKVRIAGSSPDPAAVALLDFRVVTYSGLGDLPTLTAARLQVRQGFESNRGLSTGSDEVNKGIQYAEDVALILRQNVVQGQAQEGDDHYSKIQLCMLGN